jgi:hypothetical protein
LSPYVSMVQSKATASLKTQDLMSADLSIVVSMSARFERRHGTGFKLFGYELMGTRVASRRRSAGLCRTYLVTFHRNGHQTAVGKLLKCGVDADMLESCMLRDSIGRLCGSWLDDQGAPSETGFMAHMILGTVFSDCFHKRTIESAGIQESL